MRVYVCVVPNISSCQGLLATIASAAARVWSGVTGHHIIDVIRVKGGWEVVTVGGWGYGCVRL